MARPCKCRWIGAQPPVQAFKPVGIPARKLQAVELTLDELEALRLADLEGLYQEEAADRMGVSRSTFGRILERAHQKVAGALFGSKMLVFKGGIVMQINKRTFECAECGSRFQKPYGTGRPAECPQCHSKNLHRIAEERGGGPHAGCGHCRRRRQGRTQPIVIQADAEKKEDSQ